MNHLKQIIANFHKSPVSTVCGLLVGALLAVSHQPSLHSFAVAFGVALWGIATKEN